MLEGRRTVGGITDKQRVLAATDLVKLIGEQVTLKRKGREYSCLCPFHDDHNPSMYVVPSKQIYHCFVCGAGGDALKFTIDYFKMGFREALLFLADRAGIRLSPPPRRTVAGHEEAPELPREALLRSTAFAQSFFKTILAHSEHGKAASEVLARRGVSAAMVEQFGLGAAPDRWDGLLMTLGSKNMGIEPFVAAGLLKARESSGGHYDALRNRLIFPIHDALGRVIAFGGRKIKEEDEPKYLNSPESPLFNKSATLYGLPFASAAIRQARVAIVTEGYMDCIACHQAGVTNVVATLGTALTTLGVRVLRRLCDEVVLFFDGDDAGQRAADRAIEALFAEPVEVKIATMASARAAGVGAKDPDELLKQQGGRERFASIIQNATPALEFRLARLKAQLSTLAPIARTRAVEEELARLAEMGLDRIPPIRKRLIIQHIARIMGMPEETVVRAIPSHAQRRSPEPVQPLVQPTKLRTPLEQAIGLCVYDPVFALQLEPAERQWLLGRACKDSALPGLASIAAALTALTAEGEEISASDILAAVEGDEATVTIAGLTAEITSVSGGDPDRLQLLWEASIRECRRLRAEEAALQADSWAGRIEGLRDAAKLGGSRRTLPRSGPG
ncbi:MAG: DNA primase [Phycisphaerales bacterium]